MNRELRASRFTLLLVGTIAVLTLPRGLVATPADSVFTSSNLPIVVIDTRGQTIVNEPKITADMGIIDNGPGVRNHLTDPYNAYDSKIGIEIRGSSSQMFPKKQFGVETRDTTGADADVELLGFPEESDWVFSAPYSDKSLIRDALTYTLARGMGRYASRARFFEMVINGEYKGVYVLFEKIKRDKNRVNITKLTAADTTGDKLTGGYIVKIDKLDGSSTFGWDSGFDPYPGAWQSVYYQYHDPEFEDLTASQISYIQLWIREFEVAMGLPTYADSAVGYPRYIDVNSFVDGILLSELGKNVDSYRLSTFFHKDRDSKGGKLVMGPFWDFNHAFGNCDYYEGASTSGFELEYQATNQYFHANDGFQAPFWWMRLLHEPAFFSRLRERWWELRSGMFSIAALNATVDSLSGMLGEAQARNFDRWPILGEYVWPNAYIARTHAEELQHMKTWIAQRVAWLDVQFSPNAVDPGSSPGGVPGGFVLHQNYPNPFNASTDIRYDLSSSGHVRIALHDLVGREIRVLVDEVMGAGSHAARFEAGGLASGVYVYRLQFRPDAPAGGVSGASASTQARRLALIR